MKNATVLYGNRAVLVDSNPEDGYSWGEEKR